MRQATCRRSSSTSSSASLLVFELFVLGVMVWMRHQEQRRMQALASEAFEERSIVIPPAAREQGGANRRPATRRSTAARRSRRRVPGGAQLARARWALGTPAERDARRPCRPHPVRWHGGGGLRRAWRPPTSWSATARCHSPTASAGGRHPACGLCAAGSIGPESDDPQATSLTTVLSGFRVIPRTARARIEAEARRFRPL